MIKNILTLGDSFTYGDELADVNQAWPICLGTLTGASVVNLGKSGNSNPTMLSQLIEYLANEGNPRPDLVVIGWTSPGRAEYADDFGEYIMWPGYSGLQFVNETEFRQELLSYINMYHNTEYIYRTYLHQVILAQSLLDSQGIKYVMCNIMGNEYYANLHRHKFDYHHGNLLKIDNFIGFPKQGMAEWTYSCKRGSRGHFLEDGHKKVAEKIYEHIRNLGWLS